MSIKIVSDSSSNVFHIEGVNYTTVPMKIIAGEKEYIDAPGTNVRGMVDDLRAYKGKSGSSCANAQEWLDAFGDADMAFGVTISRNLSGSYNSAYGLKGLCKKCLMLLFVIVAVQADNLMGGDYVRDAVCIGFCTNEILSIVENLGLAGVPMPQAVVKALEQLQEK